MIIDTHSHYDDEKFSIDRFAVLEDLKHHNIGKIITIGCNETSSQQAIKLAERYDFVYAAVGFHPSDAESADESALQRLINLSHHPKVVAWGEIGLDYHYDTPSKEVQKYAFIRQLQIAKDLDLPVCIHCRDAMGDTLEIVKKYQNKGVFHCFSGSLESAKELVKIGYCISFSGTVTYKNAKNVKEVAAWVPSDSYLLETDCPYLSPEPLRGTRNDSRNLQYTAQHIADLRNLSTEQVILETTENAKRLFGIA